MQRLFRHSGFRQFVKFCIVGTSSTIIDQGILWILLNVLPACPWWISKAISFSIAVSNGFYWNRHWTFKARDYGKAHTQYSIFFFTNIIGLGLNLLVMKIFLIILTGKLLHGAHNPDKIKVIIASVLAIPFVVGWNFLAAKHWTFRKPADAIEDEEISRAETQRRGEENTEK